MKTKMDALIAANSRGLIRAVNEYNEKNASTPILKEDIVDIIASHAGQWTLFYMK